MGLIRSRNLRAIGVSAAIAVGASLGVLAPAAMAAPSNDAFAAREVIPGTLPATAEGSNVGATAEENEFLGGSGQDAHHSVWWEWEAPTTQVVSIGTCGTEFRTNLGIFTGEAFGELRRAVPIEATEGPDCGSRVSFEATAGTRYDIGVDGDSFYPDPEVHPVVEGTIKLQISATPPPSNYAFEAAASLTYWRTPENLATGTATFRFRTASAPAIVHFTLPTPHRHHHAAG